VRIKTFILLCVTLFPLLAKAETLQVSGVVYPDFTRIVFNAASAPTFQTSLSGSNLQIVFASPIQANFREMLRVLRNHVVSASLEDGGKRVSIKLKNADIRLRRFRGQSFFGVDLVPQKKEAQKTTTPAPTKDQKKETAKIEQAKKEEQQKKVLAVKEKAKAKLVTEAKKKAEAKAKEKEKKKTEEVKKKPEPKPTQEQAKKPPVSLEKVKIIAPPVIKPEVRAIIQKPEDVIRVMPIQENTLLTVPWDKLVSAAIYVRGENLWVVFNNLTQVNLNDLPKKYIIKAEQINDRQSTILKLKLQPELIKNASAIWANREQNNWTIYYGKPRKEKPILLTTPEENKANEVRMVVRHAAEPLQMLDPDIGDSLFIVPVRDPANRISLGRKFVEFEILPTIQGIVLLRQSDVPTYKVSREGVSITSPNTLFTSSQVESAATEVAPSDLQKNTMYPFAHKTNDVQFMPTYYQYLKNMQEKPEATRSQLHLKMAEHYFLNGFYAESLGLLRDMLIDDPEFAATAGIKPMIAGNLFMMGRYDQSADTFFNILENPWKNRFCKIS
jgi:hypothetical protein